MRLRAIGPISIRDGDGWLDYKDGEAFDAPEHMDVKKALKRGIVQAALPKQKEVKVKRVQK